MKNVDLKKKLFLQNFLLFLKIYNSKNHVVGQCFLQLIDFSINTKVYLL